MSDEEKETVTLIDGLRMPFKITGYQIVLIFVIGFIFGVLV